MKRILSSLAAASLLAFLLPTTSQAAPGDLVRLSFCGTITAQSSSLDGFVSVPRRFTGTGTLLNSASNNGNAGEYDCTLPGDLSQPNPCGGVRSTDAGASVDATVTTIREFTDVAPFDDTYTLDGQFGASSDGPISISGGTFAASLFVCNNNLSTIKPECNNPDGSLTGAGFVDVTLDAVAPIAGTFTTNGSILGLATTLDETVALNSLIISVNGQDMPCGNFFNTPALSPLGITLLVGLMLGTTLVMLRKREVRA